MMMREVLEIQVARDRRTGFPCTRLNDTEDFIALFPVTKLQVEQWIWEGGLSNQSDPNAAILLIERMELHQIPSMYPESIKKLSRVPVSRLTQDNLISILATNLTLWNSPEEIQNLNTRFPTPTSEWGPLLRWLKGRVPSSGEWRRTLDFYAQFITKDVIREILRLNFPWEPAVEHLLRKFLETLSEQETGLPFMNLGGYELVAETRVYDKLTIEPSQKVCRPLVAGESPVWPILETSGSNKWRPLLQSNLPVVTVRPAYDESQVVDSSAESRMNTIRIAAYPFKPRCKKQNYTGIDKQTEVKSSFKTYLTSRITMKNRCPCCYTKISEEIFRSEAGLWHWEELIKTDDKQYIERKHRNVKPATTQGILSLEPVSRDYLAIARNDPSKIRSVCLSGFTKAGKGTWLLSSTGMMVYPEGNPRFLRAFPESWKFNRIECSLIHFVRADTAINLYRQMEDMWIDGDVPKRNNPEMRALRCPVLFKLTPRASFLGSFEREIIIIFNDIAGEVIINPIALEKNIYFPHIGSSTDVIFLAPAHEIHTAWRYLQAFANGLGVVTFEGKSLDLKQINLILAISQIDRLKYGSEKNGELLNIFMREPYILPNNHDEKELQDYFKTMKEVHYILELWLEEEIPDLIKQANRFGSVRYCGFSAFGFQPILEGRKSEVESCLPFEPQPVRVVDPLFWLFRDNSLVKF